MKLDIFQVDAFSKGPFTGNPAAVVPLTKDWLPDDVMQSIATENNLSETAFFLPKRDHFAIRWFTPAIEVALCGHATLATAHVIFNEIGYNGGSRVQFDCKSGLISVSRKDQVLTLDFPTDQLVHIDMAPEFLIKGLGFSPIEMWQGRDDLLCVFDKESEITNMRPDFAALKKMSGRGVIVTAKGTDDYDFVSRGFFPQAGIDEDPATGSAHTTLTPFWSKKLGKSEMAACQLSSRKGFFHCIDNGDRTLISGETILYLMGEIYI